MPVIQQGPNIAWVPPSDSSLVNVWMCPLDGQLIDQRALGTHAAWHARIDEMSFILNSLKTNVESLSAEVGQVKNLLDRAEKDVNSLRSAMNGAIDGVRDETRGMIAQLTADMHPGSVRHRIGEGRSDG